MASDTGMEFVADLASVAGFFGSEPELEYPDVPYYDNVVKVEAELGDWSVWLTYMPCQGWAELRLTAKPFSVVGLRLADISHLSVRRTAEDHTLNLRFARKLTSNLTLYLRPHVLLFWGNEAPDSDDGAELEVANRDA